MVGDQKMSKSLGNLTSLTDMLTKTDARAYRLLVLRSHYRSPIEVSPTTIADAERGLERLDALARRFSLPKLAGESLVRESDHLFTGAAAQLAEAVATVMDDDLNTPVAVAELFEALSQANSLADDNKPDEARDLAVAIAVHFAAMGLALDGAGDDIDPESAALVSARDAARAERDWAKADQLRDELVALGWVVEDAATGTKIRRS